MTDEQDRPSRSLRRQYYVDPEVQFPIIVAILIVTVFMGLFLGGGIYKLISISKDWERTHQALDFFLVLFLTLVPAVFINFAFGVYISNKIAGPLVRIRHAVNEITRGNLEQEVSIHKGDMLQSHTVDFNRMLSTLKRLLYRDHQHSAEVNEIMTECQEWLNKREKKLDVKSANELQKIIYNAKARLSIINNHFLKGRAEKQ